MTYLQLVNGVLSRLREDTISTIAGESDVVAVMVASLVNDAKRMVEQAHRWGALRTTWSPSIVAGTDTYALTDAGQDSTITIVTNDTNNIALSQSSVDRIRYRKLSNATQGMPTEYAIKGTDSNGDLQIQFFPTPDAAYTIYVDGYKNQADLSSDSDVLKVPSQPVLYYALALAARERGEVGGQTAAELFMMADRYLSDAIALDAANSPLDNVWYQV